MKKIISLITLVIFMLNINVHAQLYSNVSFSYYLTPGSFQENAMPTLEIGKTFKDVYSLGVSYGRTSFKNGKSFLENRHSLTVWSKNNFSFSGSLGAGIVINNNESLLLEQCVSFNYLFNNSKIGSSLFLGNYNFLGETSSSKYQFMGLGISYIIK